MRKIASILTATLISLGVVGVMTLPVGAVNNVFDTACKDNPTSSLCKDQAKSQDSVITTVHNIINIFLMAAGILAVITIIVGAIFFIVSAGDPAKTKKARDTILYAVVGLVVAILSFAIVNFVLGSLR